MNRKFKSKKRNMNKKRSRKGPKNAVNSSGASAPLVVYRLPKQCRIVPDKYITNLVFYDVTNHANVGSATVQWRYRNSAYDPDPALGTGAIAGFTELATLYTTYRVLRLEYKMVFYNSENFPVQVSIAPTSTDPGTNALSASNVDELPFSQTAYLSAKGGQDRGTVIGKLDFGKFMGIPSQYKSEINYAAAITTNPVSLLYLCVAVSSAQGSVFTLNNGVPMTIKIVYIVEFYNRTTLTS
jgi:hypothetical protein